jgi:hypothetical protein
MEIEAKEVAFKFKFPDLKKFDVAKDKHPIAEFHNWVLKRMGKKSKGKEFSLDVSAVVIDPAASKAFKEFFVAWMRKRYRVTKARAEKTLGWEWLDIGPREFYDGTPSWAKPGYVYVLKSWKKPPTVKIAGDRYWLNGIEATEKEYKQVVKKFGKDNLRIW